MALLSFLTSYGRGESVTLSIDNESNELKLQLVSSESHQWELDVTENAVEDGSPINDHARARPDTLVIDGIYSDAAISLIDLAEMQFSGGSRIANAYSYFRTLRDERKIVKVVTQYHTYNNMICKDVTLTRSKEAGRSMPFKITFQEINIISTEEISGATLLEGLAAGKKTLGKTTPVVPDEAKVSKAGSIAFEFLIGS